MPVVASFDMTDLSTPGTTKDLAAAALVLRLATEVVQAVQDGLVERGYTDLRPSHGFAFVRISAGGATVVDVASHLGVTKQSASQLVDQLVVGGYVSRHPDIADGRVWRLRLTAKGQAVTRAADEIAAELTSRWRHALGDGAALQLVDSLAAITTPGPLRPTW